MDGAGDVLAGFNSPTALFVGAFNTTRGGGGYLKAAGTSGGVLWLRALYGTIIYVGEIHADVASQDAFVSAAFAYDIDYGAGKKPGGDIDGYLGRLSATDGTVTWFKQIGGNHNLAIPSVDVTAASLTITAEIAGPTDFGGGTLTPMGDGSVEDLDLVIAKYDTAGNYTFAKRFGAYGREHPHHIASNGFGSFVAGACVPSGPCNFGGADVVNVSNSDAILAAYDTTGAPLWRKQFGSAGNNDAVTVAVTPDGDVVGGGAFNSTVDFGGGGIPAAGAQDGFLVRLTNAGKHVWSHAFGGAVDGEFVDGVTTLKDGRIVVVGEIAGPASVGKVQLTSKGGRDVFVALLAP